MYITYIHMYIEIKHDISYTLQLLEKALEEEELEDLQQQVWDHFKDVVAPVLLETTGSVVPVAGKVPKVIASNNYVNRFLNLVLQQCEDMTIDEVNGYNAYVDVYSCIFLHLCHIFASLKHEKSVLFKYQLNANKFQISAAWLPWLVPM